MNMHSVDPGFITAYDLRNDQEAHIMEKRNANYVNAARTDDRWAGTADASPTGGSNGIRLMSLAGLALIGFGVGLQLGIDQYHKNKRPVLGSVG